MASLFTTESKLIDICHKGGKWYDILPKLNEVIICNDSDNEEWDETNPFLLTLHRAQTSIFVDNKLSQDIAINRNNVRNLYNPIYILDYSIEETKRISDKYGIVFLPLEGTPEPIFAQTGWSIDTSDERLPSNWDFLLRDISVPFHSLIIVDRYLFAKEHDETIETTINDAIHNLKEIIDSLLKQLNQRHVNGLTISIIFDGSRACCPFDNNLARRVRDIKNTISYSHPFTIELVSINRNCFKYDETHDRFIISDYFIVDAQHKIRAFSATNNKSLCNQKISFDYIFSRGLGSDYRSSVPLVSQERVLKALYQSFKTSKRDMSYARNGRLIKEFTPANDLLQRDF